MIRNPGGNEPPLVWWQHDHSLGIIIIQDHDRGRLSIAQYASQPLELMPWTPQDQPDGLELTQSLADGAAIV
jgi:hypothetical protein